MWQAVKNTTLHTIRLAAAVAMGTMCASDCLSSALCLSEQARPTADLGVFMWAVTQQLPPSGLGFLLLWDLKPGIASALSSWDNTAFYSSSEESIVPPNGKSAWPLRFTPDEIETGEEACTWCQSDLWGGRSLTCNRHENLDIDASVMLFVFYSLSSAE